jgi:hypothetical protein
MGSRRVLAIVLFAAGAWAPRPVLAGPNDLNLLNLCSPATPARGTLNGPVPECRWVRRQPNGVIDGVSFGDDDAEVRYRSLISELGVVMAPRLVVPADTLGISGFQVSGEIGSTQISRDQPFWNGVQGVSPDNPSSTRPDAWLTTVGVFVRKGLWLPLPAVEVGAGMVHLLESRMLAWQGYAKLALHEGFHDWPLPSLAVRGSASMITGTDQVRMSVLGVDLILSKGFGILKTARLEPFGGASFLFIKARGNPIDATPSCDAYRVQAAAPGEALGDYCANAQRGTANDYAATFSFPDQDTIKRNRLFGGAKLTFATVFVSAQYEFVPAGRSRDERRANGAKDGSGKQKSLSMSAGFDF